MNIVCAIGAPWGRDAVLSAVKAGLPVPFCVGRADKLAYAVECSRTTPVVFCLNYSELVPSWLLERGAWINFHCTALPYGRGGHPIENLILQGHTETVISAHQMTADIDAGPVYGVSEPISLAGTKSDIQQRFVEPVAKLMVQIVRGECESRPQEGEPTYFTRLSDAEYRAFWASREAAA